MKPEDAQTYFSDYLEGRLDAAARRRFEQLLVQDPQLRSEYDLFARARDAGFDMVFNSKGEYTVPPPETVFLHRKLVGSFLLCARIKARINVQKLIRPYVPEE